MGLFDPPTKNIFKRVPQEARSALGVVQAFAEERIPREVGPTKHACLVAMAMATWVNGMHAHRPLAISTWNLLSIQTGFKNCARIVGSEAALLQPVLMDVRSRTSSG